MKMTFSKKWKITATVLLFSTSLLSGCIVPEFKDSGVSSNDAEESGELLINLTDAPGDFLSYTVDITSISLKKANGATIETLPLSTRVDFSQYVDMTELVTAATIPSGKYTKAVMTLDYSNAEIVVEDETSNGVSIASIVDDNGDSVTQLAMAVSLVNRNSLIIAPGIPAHLSLDFDLKSSNHIEYDNDANPVAVTVDPNLVASIEVDKDKEHRLRGGLKEVDFDNDNFTLIVRPFKHSIKNDKRFGQMTVTGDDSTSYEIDGIKYTGSEGLEILATQEKFTAVIALGQIGLEKRTLIARQVLAGSSVPGDELDFVKGHVIARDDNTLTIKGARLERKDGSVHFGRTLQVDIDETTRISKLKEKETLTISAISVGQHVHVLGRTDDSNQDAFDARNGLVRLVLTNVRGEVVNINENETFALTLAANKFDHQKSSSFNFTGTGLDADSDADPENYSIDTSTLSLDNFIINDPVIVRGHVNEFGAAPADFIAQSLIGIKSLKGNLAISWEKNSTTTLAIEADNSLTLSLFRENRFHHIVRRGARNDLTLGGETVSVIAENADHWVVLLPEGRTVHTNFDSFLSELNELLIDENHTIAGIKASGYFDDENRVFNAKHFSVKFR